MQEYIRFGSGYLFIIYFIREYGKILRKGENQTLKTYIFSINFLSSSVNIIKRPVSCVSGIRVRVRVSNLYPYPSEPVKWSPRQLVPTNGPDNWSPNGQPTTGPDKWSRQLVSTTGLQPGILKKRKKYNSMRKND